MSKSKMVPFLFTDWWTGRQTVDASKLIKTEEAQAVLVDLGRMEQKQQQRRMKTQEGIAKKKRPRHTQGAE
jgi:hypothetical protein